MKKRVKRLENKFHVHLDPKNDHARWSVIKLSLIPIIASDCFSQNLLTLVFREKLCDKNFEILSAELCFLISRRCSGYQSIIPSCSNDLEP